MIEAFLNTLHIAMFTVLKWFQHKQSLLLVLLLNILYFVYVTDEIEMEDFIQLFCLAL